MRLEYRSNWFKIPVRGQSFPLIECLEVYELTTRTYLKSHLISFGPSQTVKKNKKSAYPTLAVEDALDNDFELSVVGSSSLCLDMFSKSDNVADDNPVLIISTMSLPLDDRLGGPIIV